LTAIRKSPARRPRRPACTAHSATAWRTRRKSPAQNLAAYGAPARDVPAFSGRAGTHLPYHRRQPLNLVTTGGITETIRLTPMCGLNAWALAWMPRDRG
jgi:hypothetical protein